MKRLNQSLALMALAAVMSTASISAAFAETRDQVKSAWRNPIVKQSVIGAGVGAAAGALSERSSVLKGAGVGALTGAGTGLVDSSSALKGKPLVRSTAKGAIIGTGVSTVTDKSKLKGAAVGAGVGAGAHFIRDYLNR